MKLIIPQPKSNGFAIVELILVGVIIVAILGGIGYVAYQRLTTSQQVATPAATTTTTAAPAGTTASVDQLTQQDAQAETSVDASADSQTEQNATSANGTVSNVGGAYNESNL